MRRPLRQPPPEPGVMTSGSRTGEAARAIRFMAIEAAIFVGIPILAAVAAVMLTLK